MRGKVLVTELERGTRTVNGIIIPADDGKSEGIRPRWAKVYAVGEDIEALGAIRVGQWILIENGRWTRMIKIKDEVNQELPLWAVEYPKSVLLVSDTVQETDIFSEFVTTRPF